MYFDQSSVDINRLSSVIRLKVGPMSDRIDDVISDTIEGWSDV